MNLPFLPGFLRLVPTSLLVYFLFQVIEGLQYKVLHHHTQNVSYGLHRQQHLHSLFHCNRKPFPCILDLHPSWVDLVGGHGRAVSVSPYICLSSLSIPKHLQMFILIALTVAKKTVLLNCKDKTKLSINHWLKHANLEKLTSIINHLNLIPFHNTWSPFLQYIQS